MPDVCVLSYPDDVLGGVSYSSSTVTTAVFVAVCEILVSKDGVTLKTKLGVVQGH